MEECNRIFSTAAAQSGFVGKIPSGDWWLSLFLTVYWTGGRISAVLRTPTAAYDGTGILIRERKTRKPKWRPLPVSCRQVIESTQPTSRKLFWPFPWCREYFFRKARKIIEATTATTRPHKSITLSLHCSLSHQETQQSGQPTAGPSPDCFPPWESVFERRERPYKGS